MKKILRMAIFSFAAIFITYLWNKGFILKLELLNLIKASIAIAFIYYLVVPLSKLILLPLNIISLGLVSFLVYLFALHFISSSLNLIQIKEWLFSGFNFAGISIKQTNISYFVNLVLSSLSISFIINTLEKLI